MIVLYCRNQGFTEASLNDVFFKGAYETAGMYYRGLLRERVISNILEIYATHTAPDDRNLLFCLNDYYSKPGFTRYKEYIKSVHKEATTLSKGATAPRFTLPTNENKWVDLKDLKGKVVLVDFWFTGCSPCAALVPTLKRIHELYRHNSDLVMLNISIDHRKQWLKSVDQKIFTTGLGISAYTMGRGKKHKVIKNYIAGYPKLILIGKDGKIYNAQMPKDEGKIKAIIDSALSDNYVLQTSEDIPSISSNSKSFSKNIPISFRSNPEWNFNVPIKNNLTNEHCEFSTPSKQLVISDIEGEFGALRRLLLSGKVIDESQNWIFGNGNLILTGDFFDRGSNVTEVLWLIYKLEDEAKKAGGHVHFILGNHEVMNLSGDYRYVQDKYFDAARAQGLTYFDLYSSNSELGRWLRTKNIMAKIGENLFVHGGISQFVNKLPMTLSQINEKARPYYEKAQLIHETNDQVLELLYDQSVSPFWYRGLYSSATEAQIDSTLSKFSVKHIITGHTIIGDVISTKFNNKVIDTDVHHAEGKSEALLIEGNSYYRVNDKGQRFLLFKDE